MHEKIRSNIDHIRQNLPCERNVVDDHLNRLEDSISSRWLHQQLEVSSAAETQETLVTKNLLLQSQLKLYYEENNNLVAHYRRKQLVVTAALQRQQDARLGNIARRRIRMLMRSSLLIWRDIRKTPQSTP
jgi:hypothetical protein